MTGFGISFGENISATFAEKERQGKGNGFGYWIGYKMMSEGEGGHTDYPEKAVDPLIV